MKSSIWIAAVVGTLLVSCVPPPTKPDAPDGPSSDCPDGPRAKTRFHVAFDRVELGKAAAPLSELTCHRFMLEDGVQGYFTLDTKGAEVTPEQFYGATVIALANQGFVVNENGPEARISNHQYLTVKSLKSVGEEAYEVDRADLDQLLTGSNYLEVLKSARLVANTKDGQPQGFKIYGVRPVSVFGQLGFRSGDVIEQINGHPIASADDAKTAVEGLKGATQVEVVIDRNGTPVHKVCTVK